MDHANRLRLLFWETTAGCNLECAHCRRLDVSAQLSREDLTTEEGVVLIDSLTELGDPILVLSGGEPLMRPDIFQLAEHADKRGLPVALATNATMVDPPMAERITASGIRRVSVSLDGPDARTHDAFRRQPGSFEAALRGIAHLRELGMSLQVNCTVARHNVDRLEALYRLVLKEEVEALHIFMLVPVGCGVQIADDQMLTPRRYEEVLNWIYEKSLEGKIHMKATCAPHYYRVVRQRASAEGRKITASRGGMNSFTRGCLAATAVGFVSHKGEVFPCGYLPVLAGNIREKPFPEIWRESAVFQRMRDLDNLEGKCGGCEFKKVCLGCRARAYYETGDYMDEEPYCEYQPKLHSGGVK